MVKIECHTNRQIGPMDVENKIGRAIIPTSKTTYNIPITMLRLINQGRTPIRVRAITVRAFQEQPASPRRNPVL